MSPENTVGIINLHAYIIPNSIISIEKKNRSHEKKHKERVDSPPVW